MKFRNTNKKVYHKVKKTKSPRNYLTIPALEKLFRLYEKSLNISTILIFIFALIFVGLDLQKNIVDKRDVDYKRENLTKNLVFWEYFISKDPNYRDAYLQGSILEYQLGNILKAKEYLKKGLSLDPNSENGKKLEEFLVSK